MGRTGRATPETKDPSTPIALARDGVRLTNAGDADNAEPLAQRASGLKRAGAVPAAGGTGLGRCCTRMRAGRGS